MKNPAHIISLFAILFLLISIPLTIILSLQSEKSANPKPAQAAATRDPYKQPFTSTSPWNMPIGSAAQYAPANLGQPLCYETSCRYITEKEYIFLDRNAPLRTHQPGGGGSCGGGSSDGQVRIPDGVTFGGGSANDTGGALRSDNLTIQEWYKGCRNSGTGTLYSYGDYYCSHSILGNGVPGWCGHGGSGLSAVGGSIRTWELAAGTPIRHVLKLTLPANRLNNDSDSPQCNDGFRWPAVIADNGWNTPGGNTEYSGSVKTLCMGSLLALPRTTNCSSIVVNELSQRICNSLRDYGAYVVDVHPLDSDCHSCWQPFTLNGEPPVDAALNDNDMITLISSLQVITNNSSTNVGGGGTPVVPLIEDICPTLPCSDTSDTQNPTSSLTAPTNGATVSGSSVIISADATDNVGVTQVQFFVDNQSVGTDTSSPYSIIWNSTTKANGTYQVFARAFDAAGNQGDSAIRNITVNNVAPPSTSIWCETETATTVSPMIKGSGDTSASGGSYIYTTAPSDTTNIPPINTGSASMTINVPTTGTYTLWTRVRYVDGEQNSHFVRFNNSTSYIIVGNDDVFGSYRWVNFRDANPASIITVNLTAGANTIHFYGREPNTRIDKILLTTDSSLVPSGTGSAANCSGTTGKTGDMNSDGKVDILDLSYLLSRWGTADPKADINKDGTVSILDLSALLANWG